MKDFESLTVIIVEYYCKISPSRFKCLKMNNEKFRKVIKCNQLHFFK